MRALIAILVICLFSCKVNRHVQKFVQAVDSTGFFKGDTTVSHTSDSSGKNTLVKVKETSEDKDYEKWTVIEEYPDLSEAIRAAHDSMSAPTVLPFEGGQTFHYNIGFRRTTIIEKDHGKIKLSVIEKKTDSVKESTNDTAKGEYQAQVHTQKAELHLEKEVRKSGIPWWVWVVSGILAAGIIYLKRNKLFNLWQTLKQRIRL